MKQKIFALLFAVVASMGFSTAATKAVVDGTCGDNLTWLLNSKDSTLTITGGGAMTYWSAKEEVPWDDYRSYVKTVTLPDELTNISNYAFNDCKHLKNITLPNGVKSIGSSAFDGCGRLSDINIPNNLTSIGAYAFYNCGELTSIDLPNTVTKIGSAAFINCYQLTSITIPSNLTSLGRYVFSQCSSLTSIVWNAKNYSASYLHSEDELFDYLSDQITSVTFGEEVETIPHFLCYGMSNLKEIVLPNSVKSIGRYAFYQCTSLTNLEIPNSVTDIDDNAFNACSGLTTITIGSGLASIDQGVFRDCSNITSVVWNAKDGPSYNFGSQVESYTFGESVEVIPSSLCYNMSNLTSIEIPEGVTTIKNGAFIDCSGLRKLTLPKSITQIGSYAFGGCANLEEIYISDLASWCGVAFEEGYSHPLVYSSDARLYFNGELVSDFLTIPEGVSSISDYAFYGCQKLTTIELPATITNIGKDAFSQCYPKRLKVSTPNPPEGGIKSGIYNASCALYVPEEYIETYSNAIWWEDFASISKIEDDAIYAPHDLQAEPAPGKVTLKWKAEEQAEEYVVILYRDGKEDYYKRTSQQEITLYLNNEEAVTYTWSVSPYDSHFGNLTPEVFGEAFTVEPSPYLPTNLKATPNGDGTYTISWDVPEGVEVERCYVDISAPKYGGFHKEFQTSENSITVSFPLTQRGTYQCRVTLYTSNDHGFATTTFEVEPVEEHTITARILVQPNSGLDVSDGLKISVFDTQAEDQNEWDWKEVETVSEGNNWFSYTHTTIDPGMVIGKRNESFYYTVLDRDTCFDFYYGFNKIDCDAQIKDYTLYNLRAVVGDGIVKLSWEANDDPDHYLVRLYNEDEVWMEFNVSGDARETTFGLQNDSTMTFTWSIQPYMNDYRAASDPVYGEEFTAEASPYIPQNLKAVPNGDGTYTISWDPINGNNYDHFGWSVHAWDRYFSLYQDTDTSGVTSILPWATEYRFNLFIYDADNNELGNAYFPFVVEPVEEHDITVRVLIQPSSNYDTSNGVKFVIGEKSYDPRNSLVDATDEGNNWYSYTHTTTDPGLLISMKENYYAWNSLTINKDTCLEYLDQLRYVDCDAQTIDYRPYNLHAEPSAGRVKLSWDMDVEVDGFEIIIYQNGEFFREYWYEGEYREVNISLSNETTSTYTWSINPYIEDKGYTGKVYGEEFTIEASPYIPKNVSITPNGDGTYTISWEPAESEEVSMYGVYVYLRYNGKGVGEEYDIEGSSFTTKVLPWTGMYVCTVSAYNANWDVLGQQRVEFETQAVEEHQITARVLIQPSSNYDVSQGVTFYTWDADEKINEYLATEEGNGWYSYTWSTTEPGLYMNVQKDYWRGIAISKDTCLEYTERLRYADCDAYIVDYTPFNLLAEPGEGTVTLSWEALDDAYRYLVVLYQDGEEQIWRNVYNGKKQVTISISNNEVQTYTWSVCPYGMDYALGEAVFGEAFSVQPSPFVAKNLQAIPNGDGTYTISWDPIEKEEVYLYHVDVIVWGRNGIGRGVSGGETSETSYITAILPHATTYYYSVVTLDNNWNELGRTEEHTFVIVPIEEHSITTRILVQPSSGLDTLSGVLFNYFDNDLERHTAEAISEGNGWFAYTWHTTDPGVRVGINDDYWYGISINRDTCLEYTGNLHSISCDAHLLDYTPYNLQAEPGAGTVTLSWEVKDAASYYQVTIYHDGIIWNSLQCNVSNRSVTFTLNNGSATTYTWSVRPYVSNYGWGSDAVYGDEFTVEPSPFIPQNLQATPNGDGTYTISWNPIESDTINHYSVSVYRYGYSTYKEVYEGASFTTEVLPLAGTYTYTVYVVDDNYDYIGQASATFEIAPIDPHDITIRVLIQPNSDYDIENDVLFGWYNRETNSYENVVANNEGNRWFNYTFSITDPALLFQFYEYYNRVSVFNDSCFEYTATHRFRGTACDAVARDYMPFNLHAEPGEGRVKLTWEAKDSADMYNVQLYHNGQWYLHRGAYNGAKELTVIIPNDSAMTFTWSVRPDVEGDFASPEIFGEEFTVAPSPYIPQNLQATPNGDGTYTISWEMNDTIGVAQYSVQSISGFYSYMNIWTKETSIVTPFIQFAREYTYQVSARDINGTILGSATNTFTVEQTEPRDIKVRVLIQPYGDYDESNSVYFYWMNPETSSYESVIANAEGDGWYNYSFSITDPALLFKFGGAYWYHSDYIIIQQDTCFVYDGDLKGAPCDAQRTTELDLTMRYTGNFGYETDTITGNNTVRYMMMTDDRPDNYYSRYNFMFAINAPNGAKEVEMDKTYTLRDMRVVEGYDYYGEGSRGYDNRTGRYIVFRSVNWQQTRINADSVRVEAFVEDTLGFTYHLHYEGKNIGLYRDIDSLDYSENFAEYTTYLEEDNKIHVSAWNRDTYAYVDMNFFVPQGATELPTGTYPIAYSGEPMTVEAGNVFPHHWSPCGSYVAYGIGGGSDDLWYLISGIVTVNNEGGIIIDARNSFDHTIHCNIGAVEMTSVNNVFDSTDTKAVKIFRDGQILILRGEKVYTVTGQEVR